MKYHEKLRFLNNLYFNKIDSLSFNNQLSSFNSIIVQMSEKRDSSIDSQNEWLLLSVTLMAKVELVFVLRFRNAFS